MLIMLFFLSACSEGRDFDAENEAAATKEGGSGARSSQSAWMYLGRSLTLAGFFHYRKKRGIVSIAEGKRSACSFS